MARSWKRSVERLLAGSGLAGLFGRLQGPTVSILAYHNIVPTGEPVGGDVSLHLDQADFGRQLDLLLESHQVVGLQDLMSVDLTSCDRPLAVVTFDDAYVGTITAGFEELERRGLPATVFVPTGLLNGEPFWWDALAPDVGPLDAAVREEALWGCHGRQPDVMRWARSEGLPLRDVPEHALPACREQLVEAAGQDGITLGAHTETHANLAALSGDDVVREVTASQSWIRQHAPHGLEGWLAYPYGLSSEDAVRALTAMAEEDEGASLDCALRVDGGLAAARSSFRGPPLLIPRINIPRGLTLDGLRLRLTGLVTR